MSKYICYHDGSTHENTVEVASGFYDRREGQVADPVSGEMVSRLNGETFFCPEHAPDTNDPDWLEIANFNLEDYVPSQGQGN